MMKYTKEDLKKMQSWPLERKIQVTQTRIIEWYQHWGGKVYVSFSGGKDSTVLLDLARRIYPDIEAVFVDTGLEYPEIREFVRSKENVTWLYPIKYDRKKRKYIRTSFKSVIEEYGYPVVSKNVSQYVYELRHSKSEKLKQLRLNGVGSRTGIGVLSKKWRILIDAPFECSEKCCEVMKKKPFKVFHQEFHKYPIIGTMAEESKQRQQNWLRFGCNAFEKTIPSSQPLSFWTEQDVLLYLHNFNIPYAPIYGDIVESENGRLQTTGETRTGCMFCMFGVHLEKEPNRFQRMAVTHPKQYDYCINKLGCGKVLDYIGVNYQPLQGKEVNDC
jgi:3'-phosphoadenosine 5'-phosphosulfate sulfotransferase (PAPS reductase)/FAD synthetase